MTTSPTGTTDPAAPAAPAARGSRRRTRSLAAVALLAAVTFGLAALPWFHAEVRPVAGTEVVSVPGTSASPVLGALLLVVGAACLAHLLARGVLARVVAAAATLAALAAVAACVAALRDPATPLLRAAAEVSGVPELSGDPVTTPWGWGATGTAVLLAVAAGVLTSAAPAAAGSSRYERPTRAGATTAESAASAASSTPRGQAPGTRSSGATDTPAARAAQVDDWDALTRGEDPTR
ncbi:Trp biosynthesis-associated membrane protein [Litorihabitans aurantiacus]|uniref:Tryptophan-associated transmembrane protein (Trp_oprn_chp) n=1 Tax=Litorihabitans aurantiacus TaxID=1930061 RepID=A0AA37XDG9_9MICO|nr:Trp biosynthesis-associated membrane protein [Litorihabitans aurantiacus]GMA31123.1 hypothetical protein GCM10025875_11150 [Litorihabitans aurantiacus]